MTASSPMSSGSRSLRPGWVAWFFASGAVSLGYEVVWLRRVGLVLGGSAVASAVTLGAFMAGLALGAVVASRLPIRGVRGALFAYGALELGAAAWALGFPWLWGPAQATIAAVPAARWLVVALALLPPATLIGATWPAVARRAAHDGATGLYAANTTGAVVGVLAATFVLLPGLGVRSTELVAAGVGGAIGVTALLAARGPARSVVRVLEDRRYPPLAPVWVGVTAVTATGLAALGLEVVWLRLAAVALGASVQTLGIVLATFLIAVSVGAWVGRSWPRDPVRGMAWSVGGVGVLALVGAATWGLIPYGYAAAWQLGGAGALPVTTALLAALAMGGAPLASGAAFACAVRCSGDRIEVDAPRLYAGNTLGALVGATVGGLWLLPALEVSGAVMLYAGVCAVAASLISRRPWFALVTAGIAVALPAWDARLFAVGVHLRISDFADPSPAALRRFADEGWELLMYDQGTTSAVAVGRSLRTGNLWLSVNGKVDASTGDDMPTQVLSGELPVRLAARPGQALVVGLASGVTAGAILSDPEVEQLVIVELEPAVVRASRFFDPVSGAPLDDPRSELVVDDARAWLHRTDRRFDVIVSEPSNPWISGVSNLFTLEYWRLVRRRLRPDGVFCQWVQLYGMGPDELRALVRTLLAVFPEVWAWETIPGSDLLLVAAPAVPPGFEPAPTLDPAQVRALAGEGWLNTDDHPRIEWRAPGWLHYATGELNHDLVVRARAGELR